MTIKNEPANSTATKVIECETCCGYGKTMEMVCFGDMPIEKWEICPDCDGTGLVDAAREVKPK